MLYITYDSINISVGVRKKIKAQCRAFQKVFGHAYYTLYCGQMLYLLQEEQIIDKEFANTKKMCNEILLQWTEKYNISKIYIRYIVSDIWFVEFLEELKNRNIKCVLEFPSYPYDGEGWRKKAIEDNYYREQMHQFVEQCTTYSNLKSVLGIPCITLVNGVDIREQPEKKIRKKDESIVLLAVASMAQWHGYERIIKGMHNYYSNNGKKNIVFHMVGKGAELQYYNQLVDTYQLYEHVFFHGQLEGEELDEMYDNSDIAIGSLGFYKSGYHSGAPIKLREYCARGIPFVYGYDDISFQEKDYFACKVSNDSVPIDINTMIEFYESVYNRDFGKDMRQYTLSYLTWDRILQPVINYLK